MRPTTSSHKTKQCYGNRNKKLYFSVFCGGGADYCQYMSSDSESLREAVTERPSAVDDKNSLWVFQRIIVFRESRLQLMYHGLTPCLFHAKWDILMRAKWDHPVLSRHDTCLMINGSFKYVTSMNNGYTP